MLCFPTEIKPHRFFIIEILTTAEQIAKKIRLNDYGTITLLSANPKNKPMNFFCDELRILAMAVEARFPI